MEFLGNNFKISYNELNYRLFEFVNFEKFSN